MSVVVWEPDAESDFRSAFDASPHPDRFAATVDEAVIEIGRNPRIAPRIAPRIGTSRVRQLVLPNRLPYSLIYLAEPNLIRILAFAHHRRRPGYWRRRR